MPEKPPHTRIPVWIPIQSLRATNAYLIPGGDPVLIDPGMMTGRSTLSLLDGLRAADTRLCRISKILLTHFHVDHATQAVLVAEASGAEILVGEGDYEMLGPGVRGFIEEAAARFRENGVPEEEISLILEHHPALRFEHVYTRMKDLDIRPLRGGEEVETPAGTLIAVPAPGHTPGSTIYLLEGAGAAYVGDTLLQGITPHVTYHREGTDPLGDYLATLENIARWHGVTAYPGHRDPIRDPAGRAREIIRHHEERLQEILTLLRREGPQTGYQIARRVRWRTRYQTWDDYPPAERFFALGEALAHLRHLEVRGLVEKRMDGDTILWAPATPPTP